MIGASLFEGEQIQRADVSIVFGSLLHLEKRPPTELIPRSRRCCCCRRSSLRRSVVSLFSTDCFDTIRMELTDELPTSYYDCIVQPNAVRLMV